MFEQPIDELDRAGTCELIDARHKDLMRVEVDLMHAAEHWADLHGCENCDGGEALQTLVPGSERGKVFGGDGNPEVLEFCVAELAALRQMSTGAAISYLSDVQDLRFRHPNLHRRVERLEVALFRAREVAKRTRHLSAEAARWVDEQVADSITGLAWLRFIDKLEATIILADPELAEERRRAAETDRSVRLGRTNEHGLKSIVAKLRAADATQLDAMASHLARILGVLGDPEPFGVRRATAFGYLANPVRVFELLQRYQEAVGDGSIEPIDPDEGDGPPAPGTPGPAAEPSEAPEDADQPDDPEGPLRESDLHPAQNDADDPDLEPCPCCSGLGRLDPAAARNPHAFVKTLTGLDKLDWKKLLPQVTLYVHTTRESLLHPEDGGVARVEGIGPITLGQVGDFFGSGCHVTVKEVIDLAGVAPEDAYEASARMREAACLAQPGDAFPYAGCTSRSMDLDHVIPYLPPEDGGPPGQTHLGGLVRMTRFHHRIKTHGAWQVRHPEVGVVLWRSPHGYFWQVDGAGTHRLTQQAGQAYWDACSGRPTADVVPLHALRNAIRGVGARAPDSLLEETFARILQEHRPAS